MRLRRVPSFLEVRLPDPRPIVIQALAALDGFSGDAINAAVYERDASELIERLNRNGWHLTRHAPKAPPVELSRRDISDRAPASLPLPSLAQSSDGW